MQSDALTPDACVDSLPADRRKAVAALRKEILNNIPKGFTEVMNYGMLGYVVPPTLYPKGYHVTPVLPLPFMGVASQKNYISVYHMALYSDMPLLEWFTKEYAMHCRSKLDMGKGCIRFRKPEGIPFKLIGALASKIRLKAWIGKYEERLA